MLQKLRRFLLSLPVLTVAGVCALYLAIGFLALPAVVKWQGEKWVHEKLGHTLSLADVRFNPLVFKLEARELALSDEQGQALFGFQRLFVDFELWRSLVDQTWTFAEASLQAPTLHVNLLKDGRHNFSAILDKLGSKDPQPQEPTSLPRLAVQHLALVDARIEFSDALLAQPLITQIAPVSLTVDGFSTLAKQSASYRLTAPTALAESLAGDGTLSVNPFALKGQLALKDIQVSTLARALSRLLAIDAPAGQIAVSGRFDIAVNDQGQLAGTVQDLTLGVSALSLSAPGGTTPLLAMESLALTEGLVDLGQRKVQFGQFTGDKGQINAAINAQGQLDWATLVRPSADTPPESPAGAPWQVSIANTAVSSVALSFRDASQSLSANVNSVALTVAPSGEFGPAGLALQLGQPSLTLSGVQLERAGESVTVPALLVQAKQGRMTQATQALEVALEAPTIEVAKGLSARTATDSISVGGTLLQADRANMTQTGADTRASLSGIRLALASATTSQSEQSASLGEWAVQGKQLTLQSNPGQSALTLGEWRSTLAKVAAQRGTEGAAIEQLSLKGSSASMKQATNGPLSVALQSTTVETRGTTLQQGDDTLALRSADLSAAQLSLTQTSGQLQLAGQAATFAVAGLAAQQGGNKLALDDGGLKAKQLSLNTSGALQASLTEAGLTLGAASLQTQGAKASVGQVAQLNLAAQSLKFALPDGPFELTGQGVSAEVNKAVVNNPADGAEVARLGRAALTGGTLRLHQQQFTADTVTLAQGQASAWLDAQGQLNLLKLFGPPPSTQASTTPAAPTATAPDPATPWRIAVKEIQLDDFDLAFEDRGVQPPLAVRLAPIQARVTALDTASATPMQLVLQSTLASGGHINVDGTVHATTGASDLQLTLSDVALAPVQGYLSKFAELQLASGVASSSGRLRYGDTKSAGAQLVYRGQMAVNQFLLEEVAPKRPFLGWGAIGADDVLLTLTPDRLDIAELRIDQPSGRLIIAADQSVNLTDVLKKSEPAPSPTPVAPTDEGAPPSFPVSIARVRVADGTLEFSDASLRPQFAARMHELKGVVTGLSNDPDQSAKVQLDARVNQYGSAKIGGQISLMSPEKLTEIDMAFRNLEMTSLSPYVVKFAGYRIAGGRLWLDLQYRVKDGKLLGENKVVLKQVALGEKVESPDALNLPLELAIAILADSDGVIDIGLPVRGDLDDPQFDYGAVIGKAVGNLLGGIVTAPFKALASIFGGGAKTLDTVVFEPGSATLAPPERQKLAAVARALKERPALKLVVPPTRSDTLDTPVLKSLAVRRDVVTAMGITLAPDEDPGPVDVANARTQTAVEAVFSTRYAPEVLAALKARALRATDTTPDEAPPSVASTAATASPPQPPPTFYQGLYDRLIAEQPVSDEALAQLGTQRSDAILSEVTQTHDVPVARVALGKAQQATDADGKTVTLQLKLEVAQ